MKADKAQLVRFGSPVTGIGLWKKETVQFVIPAGNYADGKKYTQYVDVPGLDNYVSDAQYRITGGQTDPARPWSFAPRKFYFYNEAALPLPRVYLYKQNKKGQIQLDAYLYWAQPITRSYTVTVDVFVYVSHFLG